MVHRMAYKLSAIQLLSGNDPVSNLHVLKRLLAELSPAKEQLVLLPENALLFADQAHYLLFAEKLADGYYQSQLAELARQYQCYLVCGSFPIKSRKSAKIYTTSLVFSPQGRLICHYHKIHLFDAQLTDNKQLYKESDTFIGGQDIQLFDWHVADSWPPLKVGLTICYDLRFPALFQSLRAQGADIILVAAAFTNITGEAHWQTLLQARAIENQCYIIAANQGGLHACGRETFGHSLIISPWGEILSELQFGEGIIEGVFDKQLLENIRQRMPVTLHNRFTVSLNK